MTTALVSGGKDSIYSAYLADSQGWPVDELLVARPSDPDSFLLHTPNLSMVALQGEAWGKPVRSVEVEEGGEAPEGEALKRALGQGSGAVVAGAIASSYQWSRLSRICHELGRPLYTPLWGKDPGRVVREEIGAGLSILLVQVAAEPLGPDLLGRPLDRARLEWIEELSRDRRSVHAAGEGGEYESLVIDAPFFDRTIVVDEATVVPRGLAARWDIQRAHLAPKPGDDRRPPDNGPSGRRGGP